MQLSELMYPRCARFQQELHLKIKRERWERISLATTLFGDWRDATGEQTFRGGVTIIGQYIIALDLSRELSIYSDVRMHKKGRVTGRNERVPGRYQVWYAIRTNASHIFSATPAKLLVFTHTYIASSSETSGPTLLSSQNVNISRWNWIL
jgi:hypothetical protein